MPDYMYLLESRFSAEQRAALVRIQELAAAAESNLYLVGGAVRDLISGMLIRDLDFTVKEILRASSGCSRKMGRRS